MELTTEEKILTAAREVFTKKGFAAARMQEIADEADINKGLLHYYFRSKENLFRAVFDDAFAKFAPQINHIFEADLPLFEKIEAFVDQYIDFLLRNPYLPSFILNELNTNPEEFVKDILSRREKPNPMKLIMQIQMETEAGNIKPVNPIHLAINVLSMCVFPFMARPLMQGFFHIDNKGFEQFMAARKQAIKEFTFNALQKG